jgi:hypothetical protein
VNGVEFSGLEAFMAHILSVVKREGSTIAYVFPEKADVLIQFSEKTANEAVRPLCSSSGSMGSITVSLQFV